MNKRKQEFSAIKAREELRKWLVKWTSCNIQDGYPCGTCFMNLVNKIGLDETKKEYHEHNKGINRTRHNEVWRAILQIREADLEVKE